MAGTRPSYEMTEPEWRRIIGTVRAGRPLRPDTWPGGRRSAVALSFDCDHECFELGGGGSTVGRLSWGEFGRRVGVPRILEVLAKHGVPATFFMPAVCALIDPGESLRIRDAGHEVAMHGWIHENNSTLDEATERELMRRAHDVLAGQLGEAPVGFRSPNWDLSPHTVRIVRDMGLLYDSSLMADEDCYELLLDGDPSGVVEVPVEWIRDDAVYLLFNRQPATRPWTPPDDVYAIFRRELDAVLETGGLFQLVMHPFIIGYRSRIWMLDELISHAKAHGDVWFATHAAVAKWVRDSVRAR
ncbi:MAG: polysaccharide deacetylase [Gammaproteobacteria bacterium]|nr:polysaccharide deacetylase [Gammaproteobacteria bacterium]MDH4256318.1 polysaccharide deacetylase [Gammaproteobacteria bacterium]MDH5309544.1 polysaccharide deacetylase [Gammaproteobacteria bacterium]